MASNLDMDHLKVITISAYTKKKVSMENYIHTKDSEFYKDNDEFVEVKLVYSIIDKAT